MYLSDLDITAQLSARPARSADYVFPEVAKASPPIAEVREQVSHAMEVRDQVFRSNRRLVKIVEELRAERGNAVAGSEPAEA